MNTKATKSLVDENRVVTLKARTNDGPIEEIQTLMSELGNTGRGIPFLAIYPGQGGAPITVAGPVLQQTVLDAVQQAGPSRVTGTE